MPGFQRAEESAQIGQGEQLGPVVGLIAGSRQERRALRRAMQCQIAEQRGPMPHAARLHSGSAIAIAGGPIQERVERGPVAESPVVGPDDLPQHAASGMEQGESEQRGPIVGSE